MIWKPLAIVFALTAGALAVGWYLDHDAALWSQRECTNEKEKAERAYWGCVHAMANCGVGR